MIIVAIGFGVALGWGLAGHREDRPATLAALGLALLVGAGLWVSLRTPAVTLLAGATAGLLTVAVRSAGSPPPIR